MTHESEIQMLRGAYSAIFTPFDKHNQVNLEMLTRIGQFQLDNGLRGFFVTGTTGESLLLNYEERLSVIRHLVETFGDQAIVIAHVGHPSTEFAIRLAKDSAQAGAHWISAVGPLIYGNSFDGALRHYRAIATATDLPFMVYSLGKEVVPERDTAFFDIPNVSGMKYTGANFFAVQQLKNRIDRPVAMLSGFDEQFVAGQSFGFQGGIGSTYNFAPRFYSDIFNHYHRGDIEKASQLQAQVNRVTHLMVQYENWSYRKAIMKYIGFDCGPFRAPYRALSDDEYAEFAKRLAELNVLEPPK